MADLLRVSITGALPDGEQWTVNPVYGIGGDFGAPVSSTQANTIAVAIAAIAVPTGLLQNMSTLTTVTGARIEARSKAGALESQGEALKAVPTPGTSTSPHPGQIALVSSLRTATAGASGRGRLYWPTSGLKISPTNLRPINADMTSLVTAVKTYLSAIQTAIDATLDGVGLVVWSRKLSTLYPVTSIQMGNVADVQNRRRDQLVEQYFPTTWP